MPKAAKGAAFAMRAATAGSGVNQVGLKMGTASAIEAATPATRPVILRIPITMACSATGSTSVPLRPSLRGR